MKYLVTTTTGVRAAAPGHAAAGVRSCEVVWGLWVTAQATPMGGPARRSPARRNP